MKTNEVMMKLKWLSPFFRGKRKNRTNGFSVIIKIEYNPFTKNFICVPAICSSLTGQKNKIKSLALGNNM